ncbi:MAG: hypothetical protein QNK89_04450 [Lacinutrix sp.]|uniref:hypothetical protein n=1 Tax=Lacinutrix sp. TaxID=1937692 RepID=UPI0030B00BED
MLIYIFTACAALLIGLLATTDKFNPAIQFTFITGLGFLFLYNEEDIQEGKQITLQLMLAVVLISITYVKEDAGNIT